VTEQNLFPANALGIAGCLISLVIFVPLVLHINKTTAAQAAP
jgi:hypothetical protein